MDVEQTVRKFIVDNFFLGKDSDLSPAQSLLETGVLDSTGVLELVAFLERTFHVVLADEDLVPENLDSIRSIVGFVECKSQSPTVVGGDDNQGDRP